MRILEEGGGRRYRVRLHVQYEREFDAVVQLERFHRFKVDIETLHVKDKGLGQLLETDPANRIDSFVAILDQASPKLPTSNSPQARTKMCDGHKEKTHATLDLAFPLVVILEQIWFDHICQRLVERVHVPDVHLQEHRLLLSLAPVLTVFRNNLLTPSLTVPRQTRRLRNSTSTQTKFYFVSRMSIKPAGLWLWSGVERSCLWRRSPSAPSR